MRCEKKHYATWFSSISNTLRSKRTLASRNLLQYTLCWEKYLCVNICKDTSPLLNISHFLCSRSWLLTCIRLGARKIHDSFSRKRWGTQQIYDAPADLLPTVMNDIWVMTRCERWLLVKTSQTLLDSVFSVTIVRWSKKLYRLWDYETGISDSLEWRNKMVSK